MGNRSAALFTAAHAVAAAAGVQVPPPEHVVVWRRHSEDFAAFRIPALAVALDGTILAFAEGR